MTNATEELRSLLEERGVNWFGSYDSDETNWDVGELTWVYSGDGNIASLGVVQDDITPEQAIIATFGSRELTAEQVREAIEHNSYTEAYMLREFDDSSWQEIADELNATIGERTCHETKVEKWWRGCDQCGYKWEFMYGIGKCERPTYCPHCGRRVVE